MGTSTVPKLKGMPLIECLPIEAPCHNTGCRLGHAFLIAAHQYPQQVLRLINALQSDRYFYTTRRRQGEACFGGRETKEK